MGEDADFMSEMDYIESFIDDSAACDAYDTCIAPVLGGESVDEETE